MVRRHLRTFPFQQGEQPAACRLNQFHCVPTRFIQAPGCFKHCNPGQCFAHHIACADGFEALFRNCLEHRARCHSRARLWQRTFRQDDRAERLHPPRGKFSGLWVEGRPVFGDDAANFQRVRL